MKEKAQAKGRLTTVLLVVALLAGVALLAYPSVSDWWNRRIFNTEISTYTSTVSNADTSQLDALLERAQKYNEGIAEEGNYFGELDASQLAEYNAQLNLSNSEMAMMGYLTIPAIDVSLPVYHTTSDATLSAGVGHIAGTSLPVGGESTHAVLSGHRGLPSARLLTDLDQLVVGDTFSLNVLSETLTYEVDQIRIVLPSDVSALQIEQGEDLCTLVTCTPYGINSHRLLVRGHRVPNGSGDARVAADAVLIENYVVASVVAVPLVVAVVVWLVCKGSGGKRNRFADANGKRLR